MDEKATAATAEALDDVVRFVIRQLAPLREGSYTTLSTLSTLESSGAVRLTELAVREGVSQPSMTALVSRLQRQGWVQRWGDATDGRIVLVGITEAGREALRRRRAGRVAFLAALIGSLGATEQEALDRSVRALRALADPDLVPAALEAAKQASVDERVER
jgi:DNA-binding MarR family transcriptional regulator